MSRILLVAIREYRQVTATRGFWVMLLIIPLAIAASQIAGRWINPPTVSAFVLVDADGRYAPAIERRFERGYQRVVLGDLSAYVQRWNAASGDPRALWASGRRWFTDGEVDAFIAQGGLNAAWRRIQPRLPPAAPPFKGPPRTVVIAATPAGVPTDQGPDRFAAALAPWLQGEVPTQAGRRPLSLAVYIPHGFGASDATVRMWTNGRPNNGLIETIRSELTNALRVQALQASGLPPKLSTRIENLSAPLLVTAPPQGHGREQVAIRSLLPLALVYLLLVTVMVTGSMMLQGVIEERSNRLLESVLACIRPSELMYGKLLGLGAVGLTIIVVWAGCAVGAAFAVQGVIADFLRPSFATLDHPWIGLALAFYFTAGYLIISMVYLAIGSLTDSLQDVQSYLAPVVLIIMLPTAFMMVAVIENPHGLFPEIMSWIPFYTPFAMMARLGSGVSLFELIGTGVMLIAFVALEMTLLGRIFQTSLLRAGQPPRFGAFVRMMFETRPD